MTTKLRAASFQDGAVTTAKIAADAITDAKIASTVNLGRRNIVINGGMQISQRSTSETGIGDTNGVYPTLDRFAIGVGSSAGRFTMSQSTVTDLEGFTNALKIDVTTADTSIAAGEFLILQHKIEGFNVQQLKATSTSTKPFTISFYAKSNESRALNLEARFSNGTNRQAVKTITTGTSWARYTMTVDAASSTQIDNDNSNEMQINFWLHAGSTYTGGTPSTTLGPSTNNQRGAGVGSIYASTDNTLEITGVQLEVGEKATPFEHRSYAEELELCKRYFQKFGGGANKTIAHVYAPSTAELALLLRFAPEMRTSPSVDWSSDTTDLTYRYNANNSQNFDRGDLSNDGGVGQVTPQGGSMWISGWSHGQSSNDGGEIRVLSVSPEEFLFLQFDAEL